MKNMSWIIKNFAFLALIFITVACVPTINLSHTALPRSGSLDNVAVIGTINDLRPKSHGGGDFSHIGEVRNMYGMPFQLKTKNGRELDVSLREAIDTALMNAGYRDANNVERDGAMRLEIDILEFWSDGYMGYKVNATIAIRLVRGEKGIAIAEKKIVASQGFALATEGNMDNALEKVMDRIVLESADFMKANRVKTLEQSNSSIQPESGKSKASSIKEAKSAYKNGRITKTEYESIILQLKSDYKQKLHQIKFDYTQGKIDKTEYKKRADIARTDYEGSDD